MIYLLISLFLDIGLSNLIETSYQNINYFFPLILISSFPIIYLLIKNKKLFFIIIISLGLIYDTLYSDIFLLNTYYFTLYALFLNIFYKNKKANLLNVIIISTLGFIIYDIYIFFILIFLNYSLFTINYLSYKLIHSFIINFIYILLSVLILKSRIFCSKKHSNKLY